MMNVNEALQLILQHATALPEELVPTEQALGLRLAKGVQSDIDSPPHAKAMMDGYALLAADLQQGPAELTVIEEVPAGAVPQKTVEPGTAVRIMTGAPLPTGADCVVMVERTELLESQPGSERVRIDDPAARNGTNVLAQGYTFAAGQEVLAAGHRLRGIELGLLAEVGCCEVLAVPRPRVAVLSTGDELVPASQKPAAGQIRNSNSPMLLALVQSAGALPVELPIAPDERSQLRDLIAQGLESHVLLLSGGVSAGKYDFTPQVLQELGVEQVFHKVNLKPGKPLWFGVLRSDAHTKLVFGLPGNPVSSLVCFELFVRPALAALGGETATATCESVPLAEPHAYRSGRPIYHPALCRGEGEHRAITILPWKGSADMLTVCQANCLAYLPAGEHSLEAGHVLEMVPLS